MERSIFPEGIEVHQDDLARVESGKAENILTRFKDANRMGKALGLAVSVNIATPTRMDIALGRGYPPNGETIDVPAAQTSVPLADYNTGVVNLVCVVYTEVSLEPSAHESDGTSQNTAAARSFRVRVFTAAQFDLLPASDSDLTRDAVDRTLILASIAGPGVPGGIPNPIPASSIIQQVAATTPIITASMQAPIGVTGINIKAISPGMPLGTGVITINVAAGTRTLQFTAPGNTIGAVTVNLLGLPESTTEIQVFSFNVAWWVTIEFVREILNGTGGPSIVTTNVVFSELYVDTGPAFSANDSLHRNKRGTYVQTPVNPHGIGMQDFDQQVVRMMQLLELGGGFRGTEQHALLPRLLTRAMDAATTGERTLMWQMTSVAADWRIYLQKAQEKFEVTYNAYWDGTMWNKDAIGEAWKLTMTSATVLGVTAARQNAGSASLQWDDTIGVGGWNDQKLVVNQVRLGEAIDGFGAFELLAATEARIELKRHALPVTRTKLLRDTGEDSSLVPIEIYVANVPTTGYVGPGLEFVINGSFDGVNWTNVSGTAVKVGVSQSGVQVLMHSGAPSWTDTVAAGAWTEVFTTSAFSLTSRAFGTLVAGEGKAAQNAADFLLPRVNMKAFPGGAPGNTENRWLIAMWGAGTGTEPNQRLYMVRDTAISFHSHFELATNCEWHGTTWFQDILGASSNIWKYYQTGMQKLFKAGPAAAWSDSVGPGGWDSMDFSLGTAGIESTLNDGRLHFTTPGAFSNPPMTDPIINSTMAANTLKAWGCVQGGALVDGFNVASITAVAGPSYDVVFGAPLANGSYAVLPVPHTGGAMPVGANQVQEIHHPNITAKAAASFNIRFVGEVAGTNDDTVVVGELNFDFFVFGRQS